MMVFSSLRRILSAAALPVILGSVALAQGAPPGAGGGGRDGPRQVGVTTLERQSVPVTVTLPGRAVAYHQTAIRPQVGGEITEIAYDPGQRVTAGQVLFRLDDDQLAATLSAAEAAVTSAEAAVQGAQATVNRYDRLQGTGVSRADLESAQVALANARASRSAAESERDLARLAVERAEIHSPIDGVVEIASVSVGDLVTANQSDALTTVTQLDPIYVDVAESRARFLRNRERQQQGTLLRGNGVEAKLILETGQVYADGGRMVTPGIAVSATTGTVPFRLEFPNPDRQLLPGQFVRVQLNIGMIDGVLVPQRATRRSAAGVLTAFVAEDGKARQVELTEAGTWQNAWIVTEGVAAGDQLLLDGLTNMNDGTEITTVPVAIDAEGVVREVGADGLPVADAAGASAADGAEAAGAADSSAPTDTSTTATAENRATPAGNTQAGAAETGAVQVNERRADASRDADAAANAGTGVDAASGAQTPAASQPATEVQADTPAPAAQLGADAAPAPTSPSASEAAADGTAALPPSSAPPVARPPRPAAAD